MAFYKDFHPVHKSFDNWKEITPTLNVIGIYSMFSSKVLLYRCDVDRDFETPLIVVIRRGRGRKAGRRAEQTGGCVV